LREEEEEEEEEEYLRPFPPRRVVLKYFSSLSLSLSLSLFGAYVVGEGATLPW
jgi:hypothetical protein